MDQQHQIHISDTVFVNAYEEYWEELYLLCNRYLQDPELSRDVIQELFIKLWERRATLVIQTSLKRYLFRALKLTIMEHYRKQAVRDNYTAYKEHTAGNNESHHTQELVFCNDLQRAFHTVVNTLPERSRHVFDMSRNKGLNNKAIAAALMISEKAVEGNMTRALAFIRKRLRAFR